MTVLKERLHGFMTDCLLRLKRKTLVQLKVSNSLDPDQSRHSQAGQNVRPDLVPNCLKRLSADDNVM